MRPTNWVSDVNYLLTCCALGGGPPPLEPIPRPKEAFIIHHTPIVEERIDDALAA